MKKLVFIMVALLACVLMVDADPDMLTINETNVSTNTTATVTNESPILVNGWVRGIAIEFGGASSPDVDVDVQTKTKSGSGPIKTLFSGDNLMASVSYYPLRQQARTSDGVVISGEYDQVPLINDTIQVIFSDSSQTGVNATLYLFLSRD